MAAHDEDEEGGHCHDFCLFSSLHGTHQFALIKGTCFKIFWALVFLVVIILAILGIVKETEKYVQGKTYTWTNYEEIESDSKAEVAITICNVDAAIPISGQDACTSTILNAFWQNQAKPSGKTWYKNQMTDVGNCCTLNGTELDKGLKLGIQNGIKILAGPGEKRKGVQIAIHSPYEKPMMNLDSTLISPGTSSYLWLDLYDFYSIEYEGCKSDEKWYRRSTCLFDKGANATKGSCDCELATCYDATNWTCAMETMANADNLPGDKCLHACQERFYVDKMSSSKLAQEPDICSWYTSLNDECNTDAKRTILETTYPSICSQKSAVTNCPGEDYQGKPMMQKYAQDNLMWIHFNLKGLYKINTGIMFSYDLSKFVFAIGFVLVFYLGFSIITIPECLYFAFCHKKGGCICAPVVKMLD